MPAPSTSRAWARPASPGCRAPGQTRPGAAPARTRMRRRSVAGEERRCRRPLSAWATCTLHPEWACAHLHQVRQVVERHAKGKVGVQERHRLPRHHPERRAHTRHTHEASISQAAQQQLLGTRAVRQFLLTPSMAKKGLSLACQLRGLLQPLLTCSPCVRPAAQSSPCWRPPPAPAPGRPAGARPRSARKAPSARPASPVHTRSHSLERAPAAARKTMPQGTLSVTRAAGETSGRERRAPA